MKVVLIDTSVHDKENVKVDFIIFDSGIFGKISKPTKILKKYVYGWIKSILSFILFLR